MGGGGRLLHSLSRHPNSPGLRHLTRRVRISELGRGFGTMIYLPPLFSRASASVAGLPSAIDQQDPFCMARSQLCHTLRGAPATYLPSKDDPAGPCRKAHTHHVLCVECHKPVVLEDWPYAPRRRQYHARCWGQPRGRSLAVLGSRCCRYGGLMGCRRTGWGPPGVQERFEVVA